MFNLFKMFNLVTKTPEQLEESKHKKEMRQAMKSIKRRNTIKIIRIETTGVDGDNKG